MISKKPKVRRIRISTRLAVPIRDRLTRHCAASGISERAIIEAALDQYLEGKSDRALLLTRFDRLEQGMSEDRRDRELMSEAFRLYLHFWFAYTRPAADMAAANKIGSAEYNRFTKLLAARLAAEHRLRDDLPKGAP